ncbi:MAG: hypothetical protein OJF52_003692 [Nitrospira sp.]|jgi:hypothetical protein|nr:MAG: hypothetical protein OJF52_003692 [Nitrospira sp.]
MRRVVLEELTPGMVLAKPVTNAAGLVVLAAGAELDEATLSRLQRLGTAFVFVEGEAGEASGKTLAELEAELDHRFRLVNNDPRQLTILEAIRLHLRNSQGVGDRPAETPSS